MSVARCPKCGADCKTRATRTLLDTNVQWLEPIDEAFPGAVARRRHCQSDTCKHRWLSVEIPAEDLNRLFLTAAGVLRELVQ